LIEQEDTVWILFEDELIRRKYPNAKSPEEGLPAHPY